MCVCVCMCIWVCVCPCVWVGVCGVCVSVCMRLGRSECLCLFVSLYVTVSFFTGVWQSASVSLVHGAPYRPGGEWGVGGQKCSTTSLGIFHFLCMCTLRKSHFFQLKVGQQKVSGVFVDVGNMAIFATWSAPLDSNQGPKFYFKYWITRSSWVNFGRKCSEVYISTYSGVNGPNKGQLGLIFGLFLAYFGYIGRKNRNSTS